MKSVKYLHKYFSEHIWYAKLVYILAGMGLGVLIVYPIVGVHPVRWGIGLLVIAAILQFLPLLMKGKK